MKLSRLQYFPHMFNTFDDIFGLIIVVSKVFIKINLDESSEFIDDIYGELIGLEIRVPLDPMKYSFGISDGTHFVQYGSQFKVIVVDMPFTQTHEPVRA